MSDFLYFPTVKTRDAELRCFKNLPSNVRRKILPIFELTKSRKTKVAPDGDIHRRMQQIGEIQEGRPFILDLSTDDKYINPQIEQLLNPYGGFVDWQYFLGLHKDMNIIPMVHIYEGEDKNSAFCDVESFAAQMSKDRKHLAVRMPFDLEVGDYLYYLNPIVKNLSTGCSLIVLLDANFIRKEAESNIDKVVSHFTDASKEVLSLPNIEDVVMLCTTFPSSPAAVGREDAEGEFRTYEEQIYQGIRKTVNIKYGDYASINTEQIEMKGGTFVPRIDIANTDSFIYKRFRRDDGSYVRCAKMVLDDERYQSLNCWTDDEIQLASKGTPTGISPSFWISARMVYYIVTRLNLRLSS